MLSAILLGIAIRNDFVACARLQAIAIFHLLPLQLLDIRMSIITSALLCARKHR